MPQDSSPRHLSSLFVLLGELVLLNLNFLLCFQAVGANFVLDSTELYRILLMVSAFYAVCQWAVGFSLWKQHFVGPNILRQTVVGNLCFALLLVSVVTAMRNLAFDYEFFAYFLPLQLALSLGYRYALRQLVKRFVRQAAQRHLTIAIGQGESLALLLSKFGEAEFYGEQLVGYFSDTDFSDRHTTALRIGSLADFPNFLAAEGSKIHRLYCALSETDQSLIDEAKSLCENHLIRFVGIPTAHQFMGRGATHVVINDLPTVQLRSSALDHLENRLIKRCFDCCCALIFLCTLFPIVYLVFGTWIKLSSPGPVFFKQKRSGLEGKEFWCYKFRSMRVNDAADHLQATANDPRKTRVGNFMRRTNIDELPQFINVLRGEMSMVGPRPHMLKHTEQYRQLVDKYMLRHFVRPGITGWAQVSGFRGETKELWQMEGRVKRDIWYIEHWSFMLDLWILLRTIINTGEKNAY